jgi:hypothetical protein
VAMPTVAIHPPLCSNGRSATIGSAPVKIIARDSPYPPPRLLLGPVRPFSRTHCPPGNRSGQHPTRPYRHLWAGRANGVDRPERWLCAFAVTASSCRLQQCEPIFGRGGRMKRRHRA